MTDQKKHIMVVEEKQFIEANAARERAIKRLNSRWRWWLILQTPRQVWEEYKHNGYTLQEALDEEASS